VHFTNAVDHTGIAQNTLGGSGFTRINVRGNSKVSLILKVGHNKRKYK
jgi:hypothetical protein